MGALKLRVTLNHHNTQRPLFTQSNRLPNQIPGGSRVDNQSTIENEFKRDATLIDKSVNYSTSMQRAQGVMPASIGGVNTSIAAPLGGTRYLLAVNFVELIMNSKHH